MKAKELIKQIEANRWVLVRQNGSHKTFKKEGIADIITIPDHGNKDMAKGLALDALKKAGLR